MMIGLAILLLASLASRYLELFYHRLACTKFFASAHDRDSGDIDSPVSAGDTKGACTHRGEAPIFEFRYCRGT